MKPNLLIVDDEKNAREGLQKLLMDDYTIAIAQNGQEAIDKLTQQTFDIVLTDLQMSGKSGLSVIDYALTLNPQPICIMMTAYGSVDIAVEAMKRGAADFLTKPIHFEKLQLTLKRLLDNRQLTIENNQLQERLNHQYQFNGLIGESSAFKYAIEQLIQVAPTKATILLQGETGTGKELAAQVIHQNSPRAKKPFIALHCAALPQNLLESELFGYEKGAFTGATQKRIGRFEAADGGTLFLDEIGEIDAVTQIKLLRFLETKTFERLGSTQPISVDVRLIAATHRDLKARVMAGLFREDLYYRLSIIPIILPALKDRKEDILPLIHHYLKQFANDNKTPMPILSPEAATKLQAYNWPGNIRELKNLCENLTVLKKGKTILAKDLPILPLNKTDHQPTLDITDEKEALKEALSKSKGNKTLAANMLGINRRTLHRKLLKWPELNQ